MFVMVVVVAVAVIVVAVVVAVVAVLVVVVERRSGKQMLYKFSGPTQGQAPWH